VRNAAPLPAPDTTISSGPASSTSATSATFSFSGTGSSLECALDGAAWGACTSPKSYSGLAAGQHTFAARALASDGTPDASPATWTWTVQAAPQANLLANGSFESGLGGWYGYRASLSLVAGAVGSNAARVTYGGTGSSFSITTSPVPVTSATAGTVYSAAAVVRSDRVGRTVCLRVRETASGATVGGTQACVQTSTAWQSFPAVSYRVQQSGSSVDVYAFLDAATAGDSFDLDDVQLR
jgi:hypothetical protein